MITVKRASECTFTEALEAWNEGFKGYYVNMEMSLDRYLTRMIKEGLSPEYSVIAFDENKPVGCILNGIRSINGKNVAWNGGTGVSPDYRNKGVGKLMMEETIKVYTEANVQIATLEAISDNQPAIALYEKMGYHIKGQLMNFGQTGEIKFPALQVTYRSLKCTPKEVGFLSIYNPEVQWQTQIESIKDGEAIILYDHRDREIAYAIYRRTWTEYGEEAGIYLYQCRFQDDLDLNMRYGLLKHVFQSSEAPKYVVNLPMVDTVLVDILNELGFSERIGQVSMEKTLELDQAEIPPSGR